MYIRCIKKKLSFKLQKKGGRNNQGIITIRHRGGGLKRRIRSIDFFSFFYNIESIVLVPFIYDPLRTSFVSLILYKNGVFSFILRPRFLETGNVIFFSSNYSMNIGNTCPLRIIPEGIFLNSVQFKLSSKKNIARSAGCCIFIINKFSSFGNKILVKLPSSEEYYLIVIP